MKRIERCGKKSRRSFALATLGLSTILLLGCSGKTADPRVAIVRGTVEVDAAPAEGVILQLHPLTQDGVPATGVSDKEGHLSISTYTNGDGVVPGSYQVTCTWGTFDPMSRQMTGDRLVGRYASTSDSKLVWEITPGEENDVGVVRLETPGSQKLSNP
ncbi:hypothetical protein [Rubripirellula reticaptiva]|uniref:Carboxypeptidase regulatory-like domain-containing protein n=1 Tax=Rubripirellula reticaptiva TaxID=2528013 RepID=A0A5C6FD23_9BACT|nr:hypothetical protein [Rubripirellula reticaptiva]TWU58164.1 hypothetical protein Poly59_10730 [Rubripirellula reticaptiva]